MRLGERTVTGLRPSGRAEPDLALQKATGKPTADSLRDVGPGQAAFVELLNYEQIVNMGAGHLNSRGACPRVPGLQQPEDQYMKEDPSLIGYKSPSPQGDLAANAQRPGINR